MKTSSLLVSMAVSGLALAAAAVDGVWQPNEQKSAYVWTTASYWKDSAVPLAVNDTASFLVAPDGGEKEANYRDKYPERVNWSLSAVGGIGTVVGRYGYWITITSRKGFTLVRPDDFDGLWAFQGAFPFTLPATADHTPVLRRFNLAGGSYLTVPDAGTSAVISNAVGSGALTKKGSGGLTVVEGAGEGMNVIHKAGGLDILGRDVSAVDLDSVLAGAALHFDAAKDESFVYDGNGKVSRWKDVRGDGYPYAYQYTQNGFTHNLPTRQEKAVKGALAVVDFGPYNFAAADAVANGSASLWWSFRPTNVCEAFFIETPTAEEPNEAVLFGDPQEKLFRRAGDGALVRYNRNSSDLAKTAETGLNVRDGDFAINGNRVLPSQIVRGTELRLFSFRARENGYAPLGSFAANYGACFGGVRIGEAVVFTNFLSSAERAAVIAHLKGKWLAADANGAYDVGSWQDQAGQGGVCVAADRALAIREYATAKGTFTKSGPGDLKVGRFVGGSVDKVVVSGGSFGYGGVRQPSADATFAAAPYRHYDASDETAVEYTESSGKLLVTGWKDVSRDEAKKATRVEKTSKSKDLGHPQLVRGASNGKAVVDFGPLTQSTADDLTASAAMKFDEAAADSTAHVREGFLVFKRAVSTDIAFELGSQGGNNYPFFPNSKAILREDYSSVALQGGEWTRDGEPIDPVDNSIAYSGWATEFHVLRFSATEAVGVSTFFLDRGGNSSGIGGGALGEVILYDRELTPQERLDTEAYLLAKWKGESHPAAQMRKLESVEVVNGAVLSADGDLSVRNLQVSGPFVKEGASALTVGKITSDGGLAEVDVRQGSLTVDLMPASLPKPLFRFDAADTDAFTYTTTDNGDGTVTTNITRWADADRNGVTADSYFEAEQKYYAKANPTLTTAEIAPGVIRPVVSFGGYSGSSVSSTDAAGMYMSTQFANVRDTIEVMCRTHYSMFVQTACNAYHYHQGGSPGVIFSTSNAKQEVREGLIEADGQILQPTDVLPVNQFHLLALSPTGVTAVNTLASDRNCGQGGLLLAENVGFDRQLTETERTLWTQSLRHKWFGEAAPVWTNTALTAVSIGAGATLVPKTMGTDDGLCFDGLSSLEIGVSGTKTYGAVVAKGALAFGADVCVLLKDKGVVGRLEPGLYPIVTAPGGITADLSRWTVSADFESHRSLAVKQVGNAICLEVGKLGLTVIVK